MVTPDRPNEYAVLVVALLVCTIFFPLSHSPDSTTFSSSASKSDSSLSQDSQCNITWRSREQALALPLESNTYLESDQIVIQGAFVNDPSQMDLVVVQSNLSLIFGIVATGSGELVVPPADYYYFDLPPLDHFAWSQVDGIVEGDFVRVEVNFTNGDSDIMVWWADTDNATWRYGNNLVEDQMATGAKPEVGSFVADRSGSIMIGVFDYDFEEGSYSYIVDTRSWETTESTGLSVFMEMNDYNYSRPGNFHLSGLTINGSIREYWVYNITIQNVFAPVFTSLEIQDAAHEKLISWNITDRNALDTHSYDLYISADDGLTYQLIASRLQSKHYNWDYYGWMERSYKVKVCCIDSYGFESAVVSEAFDAGTVVILPSHHYYISIQSSGDISIYQHQRTRLEWTIHTYSSLTYKVTRNSVLIQEGEIIGGIESVVVEVASLSPGSYEYMMQVRFSVGVQYSNTIIVEVLASPPEYPLYLGLSIGVTTGSLAVIIMGIISIIAKRKDAIPIGSKSNNFYLDDFVLGGG